MLKLTSCIKLTCCVKKLCQFSNVNKLCRNCSQPSGGRRATMSAEQRTTSMSTSMSTTTTTATTPSTTTATMKTTSSEWTGNLCWSTSGRDPATSSYLPPVIWTMIWCLVHHSFVLFLSNLTLENMWDWIGFLLFLPPPLYQQFRRCQCWCRGTFKGIFVIRIEVL